MNYSADHTSALADIRAAGADVTFSKTVPGVHDPLTGTFGSPTTVTVNGAAMRVKGDPQKYLALKLIESQAPTLLFAPDTYGQLPALDSTVSFGGTTYTVKDVEPLAPDGVAILARVAVSV